MISLAGCGSSLPNLPENNLGIDTIADGAKAVKAKEQVARDTKLATLSANAAAEPGAAAKPGERQGQVTFATTLPTGQRASAANSSPARAASASAYLIGAQDVIEISVFKVPELSKSVQVADTGTVNLPLIGEVHVEGKTAQQVERILMQKYGAKYLRNPQITVYVKEFNSRRVTVNGAVKNPGVFAIRGRTTLISVLAMAGGMDESSHSTVVVFRPTKDGKRKIARFDVSAIEAGKAPDPVIQSGDQIIVGKSAIKAAFQGVTKALPLLRVFTFF